MSGCLNGVGGERKLDGVNDKQAHPTQPQDYRREGGLRFGLVLAPPFGTEFGGEPAREGDEEIMASWAPALLPG